MFEVYVREDNPGGEVLMSWSCDTAVEAESRAMRMLIEVASQENTPISVTPDGAWSPGDDEAWGGELIITHPNWPEEGYRLVMAVED